VTTKIRTPKPETETLYTRVEKATLAKARAKVGELGWPHTLASVINEALKRGIDLVPNPNAPQPKGK
jgi:hypothetical protein